MAVTGLAKGPRLAGSVAGFYAPLPLQGIITHMGEYFHAHYVDEQRTMTAHLDSYGVAAGSTTDAADARLSEALSLCFAASSRPAIRRRVRCR
jgi:alpha-acetolactate decarboxylase